MARYYIQVFVPGPYGELTGWGDALGSRWQTVASCNFPDHAQAQCRDLVDNQGQQARVIDIENYGKVVYTYHGKHSEY